VCMLQVRTGHGVLPPDHPKRLDRQLQQVAAVVEGGAWEQAAAEPSLRSIMVQEEAAMHKVSPHPRCAFQEETGRAQSAEDRRGPLAPIGMWRMLQQHQRLRRESQGGCRAAWVTLPG
jgi:hypothetical protein